MEKQYQAELQPCDLTGMKQPVSYLRDSISEEVSRHPHTEQDSEDSWGKLV